MPTPAPIDASRAGPARRSVLSPNVLLRVLGDPLLLTAAIVLVAGPFLWLYLRESVATPVGFDTPKYIWRANLVAESGLDALPASGTSWFKTNADRPGYPIFAGVVRFAAGVPPFDLAFVLPALMGTLIGLSAGAFAVSGLREPPWAFPVYAAAVGGSVNVALTAVGLADNLVVDALVMGAALPAIRVADGQGGAAAAVLLLAAAGLVHWPFALVFLLVLAALALSLIPESFLAWRRGAALLHTPTVRLGGLVAGAGVVAAGAFALTPAAPDLPRAGRGQFVRKLAALAGLYRFTVVGPVAAAGAAALLLSPRERTRRFGLLLALVWTASGLAAVALVELGATIAAHRMLGFALGIPILLAAAMVGVARMVGRLRPFLAPLAVLLIGAGLWTAWSMSQSAWGRQARSWIGEEQHVAAQVAGQYLAAIGPHGPVVFVVNPLARMPGSPTELSFRAIRAGLPGTEILDTYIYLGDPANLLVGRPTLRPPEDPLATSYNKVSLRHWVDVRPLLDRNPVVLLLPAFNEGLPPERQSGEVLAPGLILVRGPAAPGWRPSLPSPPLPPTAGDLVGRFAIVLALLTVVGLGWSASVIRGGWMERAALAPGLGLAVIVLGGTLLAFLGTDGLSGLALPLAAGLTVVGWGPVAVRRARWARARA